MQGIAVVRQFQSCNNFLCRRLGQVFFIFLSFSPFNLLHFLHSWILANSVTEFRGYSVDINFSMLPSVLLLFAKSHNYDFGIFVYLNIVHLLHSWFSRYFLTVIAAY